MLGPGTDGGRLLIQFASTEAAIEAQVDALRRLIRADALELVTGSAEADTWRGETRGIWAGAGIIVRASWLPANLPALLSCVKAIAREGPGSIELVGRAGVGAGLMRIDGDEGAGVTALERLRAQDSVVGHVVVLRADASVKERADVWGAPGDHPGLLGAIKRAFDPAGILNAGRGPI